jgi:predicted Zn-dependent protease
MGLSLLGLILSFLTHGMMGTEVGVATPLAPAAKAHPLPHMLAQWQDPQQQGDYFDQVKKTRVGYLVWSHFPVQVLVEPASTSMPLIQQKWPAAVTQVIQEWQTYFPLGMTTDPTQADIVIAAIDPQQPSQGRVRSAETRYRLYIDGQNRLAHRCTIQIRVQQTQAYISAAVRHELGHALGIWGHSPIASDALYFSQVRTPATISVRDINTLKRVYQQPTRLGWPLNPQPNSESNPIPTK